VIWERADHDSVEGREDGGVGSDTEGEGADRDGGEGRGLAKEAEAVAKVGEESSHVVRIP
jgi:hypothetical protein